MDFASGSGNQSEPPQEFTSPCVQSEFFSARVTRDVLLPVGCFEAAVRDDSWARVLRNITDELQRSCGAGVAWKTPDFASEMGDNRATLLTCWKDLA